MSDFAEDTNVPTNDLISRQAAIDIVLEYAKRMREPVGTPEDNEMFSYGRGLLIGIERNLKQLPSAGRYSKWSKEFLLSTSGGTYAVFRCLKCSMASQWPTTYCPSCGAKMEASE